MNDIEVALTYFKKSIQYVLDEKEPLNETEEVLKIMNTAISALEKQLNGGWIPVGERLPKEVGFYIFQLNDERIHEYYYANESLYGDCDGDEPIDKMAVNLNDVIAWQKCPEPYKEVE